MGGLRTGLRLEGLRRLSGKSALQGRNDESKMVQHGGKRRAKPPHTPSCSPRGDLHILKNALNAFFD